MTTRAMSSRAWPVTPSRAGNASANSSWKDERKGSGKVCLDGHGRAPAEFEKVPKAEVM
ncbi:hypothetical protein ABZS99_47640 [Streptomyces sp. NPDC005463]|uniref:hypothetical protein n=1 Tax=unclassified Streptomyces TaxID=2593676 RepID=UPI0033BC6566